MRCEVCNSLSTLLVSRDVSHLGCNLYLMICMWCDEIIKHHDSYGGLPISIPYRYKEHVINKIKSGDLFLFYQEYIVEYE